MRAFARITLLFLCLFGAGLVWAQTASPIRIGAFLAVTGDAAYVGAPQLATLQLYIELINAQGGVNGRPLELIYYDVGIDTRSAQIAVHRLIEVDRVDLIIGGSTTGAAMVALPLIEAAKIPFIALAGSTALIEPERPWVFKTSQTDRIACAKILQDMKKRALTRVALLSGDSGFATAMAEQCRSVAPDYGVVFVANQTYPSQTRKVAEPMARLQAVPNIEAVLALDFGSALPYLAQAYRRSGLKAPLYLTHAQATDEFLDLAGDAAEGVRMPIPPLSALDQLDEDDPAKRLLRAYVAAYRKRWGVAPNVYGTHAHDALLIAVNALARAGSADKEAVRRAIETTSGFAGGNGIYRMSAQDHLGLDLSSFRMAEVRNGSWVLIE